MFTNLTATHYLAFILLAVCTITWALAAVMLLMDWLSDTDFRKRYVTDYMTLLFRQLVAFIIYILVMGQLLSIWL